MDAINHEEIRQLFDDYIRMYASRDDRLTEFFSEDFSGITGSGEQLTKERDEWVAITRQDFAQVKEPLRIEHKDLITQSLSDTIVVATSSFTIHLPIKDHILSRKTARLVLIFRKETAGWKICHSSISIPFSMAQEGEIYPLQEMEERNKLLEELIEERTRELSETQKAAEAASIAKSQFLANMSHEIRSPLNGILGMAQILEMTELSVEQRDCVQTLELSGKNLLYLVDDILDLSKIEAGKTTLEVDEFSLRNCISGLAKMQKALLYQKNISLKVDVAEEVPDIMIGDQVRIKQILHNLLGNAVKFTERGAVTISAQTLEQHASTSLVQIKVQDTGIGIASEALERIFLPFMQEDATITRRYGGTGLGLTISQNLAELMSGHISVESTLGAGSSFALTIPLATTAPQKDFQVKSYSDKAQFSGQQLRILLAEDDPVNMKVGTKLLGKLGHEVVVVENGKQCLAALEQGRFDVVLMDIQMPVINGRDALLEIRKKELETHSHQPVIALTAFSMRGEKERFLADGFDGYASKPLEMIELLREIRSVVNVPVKAAPDQEEGCHE